MSPYDQITLAALRGNDVVADDLGSGWRHTPWGTERRDPYRPSPEVDPVRKTRRSRRFWVFRSMMTAGETKSSP